MEIALWLVIVLLLALLVTLLALCSTLSNLTRMIREFIDNPMHLSDYGRETFAQRFGGDFSDVRLADVFGVLLSYLRLMKRRTSYLSAIARDLRDIKAFIAERWEIDTFEFHLEHKSPVFPQFALRELEERDPPTGSLFEAHEQTIKHLKELAVQGRDDADEDEWDAALWREDAAAREGLLDHRSSCV